MRRLHRRAAALAPYALFLLQALALVGPALLPGQVLLPAQYLQGFFPWRAEHRSFQPLPWNALLADSVLQYLPWRAFAHDALRSGALPLWNPHQLCGTPFLANGQSALFYPPNLLFWLLPAARAFGWSALLHLFAAGAFLYLYLRHRGLGRPAAALGGATFELCSVLVAWLELPTAVNVLVWLPLALLFYERAREPGTVQVSAGASPLAAERAVASAGRLRGLPLVFPLAMMLLAGHPQFALYSLFALALYALAHPPAGKSRREQFAALAACLGLPLVLAGLLAAAQLLPTLELSRLSHRAGGSLLATGLAGYRAQALPAWAAVVLFVPRFFGDPMRGTYWGWVNYAEFVGYAGVLPLILAGAALLGAVVPAWRRDWLAALPKGASRSIFFFAGLAALAAALSFRTPLGDAFYALAPGFGRFGSPGRMLCLFSLAVAVLAGFGAEGMLNSTACRVRAAAGSAGVVLLAGLGLAGAAAFGTAAMVAGAPGDVLAQVSGSLGRFAALWAMGAAALGIACAGGVPRRLAGAALVLVAAGDLLAAGWGFNPAAPEAMAYPPSETLDAVRAREPRGRILALTPLWSLTQPPVALVPPNGATAYGLDDVNGYDSLYLLSYKEFLNRLAGKDTSPQENGNMVLFGEGGRDLRWLANPDFRWLGCRYILSLTPLAGNGLELVRGGPVKLYRYRNALPRAFVTPDPDRALAAVWEAHVTDELPTCVTVDVAGAPAGVLVLLDSTMPGWRAFVDGRPAAVERVRGVFRGVRLPGGARSVTFRYEPASFRLGLFLSLLALAAVSGLGAARYKKSAARDPTGAYAAYRR